MDDEFRRNSRNLACGYKFGCEEGKWKIKKKFKECYLVVYKEFHFDAIVFLNVAQ